MGFADKLVGEGKAYCDDTPLEEMRRERGEGIESKNRGLSVEENRRLWAAMKEATEEGRRCCLRAKIDMLAKNKCMRDPVLYRCCVDPPHHRTGDRYKVYPVYDFACPIVDSVEGVTHALRTNEYADRIPQYDWVQTACGIRKVTIYEFSRLNFVNTPLSKRHLTWFVQKGLVEGWDDPRFPTVRGIVRRGLESTALLQFLLEQGPSKNVNVMEWDKLWAKNKQHIDPVVPRYFAVGEDAVPVQISNCDGSTVTRALHPKNPAVGSAAMPLPPHILLDRDDAEALELQEEFTLMRWGNAIVEEIVMRQQQQPEDHHDDGGGCGVDCGVVERVRVRLHLEGDFKTTKKKLHWVPAQQQGEVAPSDAAAAAAPLVRVEMRELDHLITKRVMGDTDSIEDVANPHSLFSTHGLADPAIADRTAGDKLQLERRGYFIVDRLSTKDKMVLIKIPDGRSKQMSTLSQKVDACKLTKGTG
eukprot:GHVU01144969.1.p1 GENE.GHVU01144969.1~~GHVU01144969.1.p1  ORF type:complete len:473 (+),score=134.21 GHVU01144969.1:1058-2476(+)